MNSAEAPRNVGWFALPLLLVGAHSHATDIRDPSVSSNAGINNSAVRLDGRLFLDRIRGFDGCEDIPEQEICLVLPWVINVYAGSPSGECLRLDITSPPQNFDTRTDLQLVVIDPFGVVYRNDNRSFSDFRPLVKINTQQEGWYTVHVQRAFDETGRTNFTLRYGRYNAGNANCANPTQPLLSQEAAAKGFTGEQEASAAMAAKRERRQAVPAKSSSEAPEGAEEPETP
jgi:hypothetical protein